MGEFLIGLVVAAVVMGITGALRQQFSDNAFVVRLPILVGALLAFGSWWLPWLNLDVLGTIQFDELNRFLAELGIGVTQLLMETFGTEGVTQVAALLGQEMPGWVVVALMPSTAVLPRLAIGLVFFTGIGLFITTALSFIPNETIQKITFGGTMVWSFLLVVLLLFQLPAIDAWGTHNTFWQALGVAVLGIRLGWGAWIGFFGILLAGIGGAMAFSSEAQTDNQSNWDAPEPSFDWS